MGKKFTIQVCGFQFDMNQSPLSPEAYKYWSEKTNRELEEYVLGIEEKRVIPKEADFMKDTGDFLDLVSARADDPGEWDTSERSGSYIQLSDDTTMQVSDETGLVFEAPCQDLEYGFDEVAEWYDDFLPEGHYLEAYYTNKGCTEYELELPEGADFSPENVTGLSVDWEGTSIIIGVGYYIEDDEYIKAEQIGVDSTGKGSGMRLFVSEGE